MNRKTKLTGLRATRSGLWVHFNLTGGVVDRPMAVLVPWGLMADQHEELVNGIERVYTERLQAEADVLYLPLESWE